MVAARQGRGTGVAVVFVMMLACPAWPAAAQSPLNLQTASLEDLMNVEVTSPGRREQRAADVAGAVFVISQEDIRRSGLTSVPELLRLAPGVQVARIDASKWAVSIRGQNRRFSDKLLVLVDGRSLYTRQFSGVFWDAINVLLEDIERIEVVRGPGGATWGANAVNGVINIITKSSATTQGVLVRSDVGTQDEGTAAVRYGSAMGRASYRMYVEAAQHGHSNLDAATAADDGWATVNGGARLDWTAARDRVMVQADLMRTDANYLVAIPQGIVAPPTGWPRVRGQTDAWRGSGLGRWTRTVATGQTLEVQGYVDADDRDGGFLRYRSLTYDADGKFLVRRGRHDLVTGGGFRSSDGRGDGSFALSYSVSRTTLRTVNLFVQDEIRAAADRLRFTLGGKLERDTLSGWNAQPTARALWAVTPAQRAWTAISRAVRTPSLANRFVRVNLDSVSTPSGLPGVVSRLGSEDFAPEEVLAVEGGYRFERSHLSLDLSAFTNSYDHLATFEPIEPHVELTYGPPNLLIASRLENRLRATARGFAVAGRWSPAPWWRVDGSYSHLRFTPDVDPSSQDPQARISDGSAPRHQWSLRPQFSLGGRVDLNVLLFGVGRLSLLQVPAYTRADARVEWRAAGAWSLAVTAQNLFGDPHAEFAGLENLTAPTSMPRQVIGRVVFRLPRP